jgi:hypothetical protein
MNTNLVLNDGDKFKHHSGGVVQVWHQTKFGTVPEALLEDERLGLDARAVAAWLAIKQDGWMINIGVLRHRLAFHGKILGKERWKRIAEELEAAEYLSRRKTNGPNGQWIWNITFSPVPGLSTIGGLAAHGSATSGCATDDPAVPGKPGHNVLPEKKQSTKNKTTTTSRDGTAKESRKICAAPAPCALIYPSATSNEIAELQQLILECNAQARQDVLDELEGYRRSGGIRSGILPLAGRLIELANEGKFSLAKGHVVQAERARRLQNEVALKQSTSHLPTQEPSAEFAEKWFPKSARRIREQTKEDG